MILPFHHPDFGILAILALVLDAALGNTFILRSLPGPDRAYFWILETFSHRLNRPERSERARFIRGLILIILLTLASFGLGTMIDTVFLHGGLFLRLLCLFVLATFIGQRAVWDLTLGIAKALDDPKHQDDPARYQAARWSGERTALRFADGLVTNLSIFMLLGFKGLLAFRVLSMTMAVGAPSGLIPPKDVFFTPARFIFQIVSYVPSVFASLILATGTALTPGGRASAFKGFVSSVKDHQTVPSRRMALLSFAYGFQMNFQIHPDIKGKESWVGPEDGRARPTQADLRRIIAATILSSLISLLILVILTALILV